MKRQIIYLLFFIPVFTACLESPVMTTGIVNGKEKPTVLTYSTDPDIDNGSLLFQGEITSIGKSDIIEKGFYWSSVSKDLNKKDTIIVPNTGADIFTYELKGASGDTTYYWQAFAKNMYGEDYGEVQSCRTPPIWVERTPLNAFARGQGAIFLINNKIYITCGVLLLGAGKTPTDEAWVYDIDLYQWQQITSFTGDKRIYPVVFIIGNLAFVGTGLNDSATACNDFYAFNSTAPEGGWTHIDTPDDFEARYKAVAFSLNGYGYVVGGYNNKNGKFSDVWRFNGNNNLWNRISDFPVPIYGGISVSNSTRAFVGFGENEESSRTLWEYSDKDDKWSEFAKLPQDVVEKISSGVIVQNTIYIVDYDNQIWTLDLSDKTWTKKAQLPIELLLDGQVETGHTLLTSGTSNSIYVGLGFSKLLYEYRPLWDN